MPNSSHACRCFSSLAWAFKFFNSVFYKEVYKVYFVQKTLICEECIDLDAYECMILQFISVFITPHI
jgi:hypothetical protein